MNLKLNSCRKVFKNRFYFREMGRSFSAVGIPRRHLTLSPSMCSRGLPEDLQQSISPMMLFEGGLRLKEKPLVVLLRVHFLTYSIKIFLLCRGRMPHIYNTSLHFRHHAFMKPLIKYLLFIFMYII